MNVIKNILGDVCSKNKKWERRKGAKDCNCISKYGDGTGHCERCGGWQNVDYAGYFDY